MKTVLAALLAVVILVALSGVTALAGPYDKYLKPADIQQVTGLKGVKLVPKNPSIGAGGDLNFARADDKLILMVQIVNKSNYAGFKQMYFKPGSGVKNLGAEAFTGSTLPGMPNNLCCFRKGNYCVALTCFGDYLTGKNMLTVEQLIALAKIIDSRM